MTATKFVTGTVACTITYGPSLDATGIEWVTLTNTQTGRALTLDLVKQNLSPRGFRKVWGEVWHLITNTDNGDAVEVSEEHRKAFAQMCAYTHVAAAPEAKAESKTAVAETVARITPALNGVNGAAEKIHGMRQVIENVKNDTFVILQYDIPEGSGMANPSGLLWWHGFRMTKSVWVLPSKQVAASRVQALLNAWKAYNVDPERTTKRIKFRILPFAEETMTEIREMAVEALDEYVRELHTSLISLIATADENLAKAHAKFNEDIANGLEVTQNQLDAVDSARDNSVRSTLRKKGQELNAAIECAELFDATMAVDDLLKALRHALQAQIEQFNEAMAVKGRKPAPVV